MVLSRYLYHFSVFDDRFNLMSKSSPKNNESGTILPIAGRMKGFRAFFWSIYLKVRVIVRHEFKPPYYDVEIRFVKYNAAGTPSIFLYN